MSDRRPDVLVTALLSDDLMAVLRDSLQVTTVVSAADLANPVALAAALAPVEGCLLSQPFPITSELLDQCPQLRVISKVGVGYDKIDVPAATRHGVLVCNTPGVLSGAVADFTFALLLALARMLRQNEDHVRSGAWLRRPGHLGHDVRGRTLGILGLGGIGRTVALTARGFDMKVIYHKRNRDHDVEAAGIAAYRDRDTLFAEADIVSLHCPLTSATRRSVGAHEFGLMKPTSYFINTSRGAVVDTQALVDALQSGSIAGAALDVTDPEPLDADHPLCAMENVVLTPHVGSGTIETRTAMHGLAVRNLVEGMRGETPAAAINPDVVAKSSAAV